MGGGGRKVRRRLCSACLHKHFSIEWWQRFFVLAHFKSLESRLSGLNSFHFTIFHSQTSHFIFFTSFPLFTIFFFGFQLFYLNEICKCNMKSSIGKEPSLNHYEFWSQSKRSIFKRYINTRTAYTHVQQNGICFTFNEDFPPIFLVNKIQPQPGCIAL